MKKIVKSLMVFSFIMLISLPLSAGNEPMVKNRVDELNIFSREAIDRIGARPENGKINIKVRAIPAKNGFIYEPIVDEEINETKKTSESEHYLSQQEEEKFFSFREGISRIVYNKPRVVPYITYGNDGEYISFRDAIINLNKNKIQQR
ncbi:hypothetical protein [Desulfobacterium sp. N47]|uniref:Uncharacterized protein n=1 Tax=uncultured Desulfobacterium sp. TaxID=201089 RepID=E1YLL1_9BACT|nr:unknown protein [uncultured Desulfobacterium sp.]